MRVPIYILILSLCIQSCNTSDSTDDISEFKEDSLSQDNTDIHLEKSELKASNIKIIGDLSFGFSETSAFDYLARIGKSPSVEDRKSLNKESVFMLVISNKDATEEIFDSKELTMNSEDAVQYLIGKVTEDFIINQEGKRFIPEGVQYDGKIGSGEKLRLTFFFKDVDLKKPFTIEYYDRLFGKGLIKMKNTTNELISTL